MVFLYGLSVWCVRYCEKEFPYRKSESKERIRTHSPLKTPRIQIGNKTAQFGQWKCYWNGDFWLRCLEKKKKKKEKWPFKKIWIARFNAKIVMRVKVSTRYNHETSTYIKATVFNFLPWNNNLCFKIMLMAQCLVIG